MVHGNVRMHSIPQLPGPRSPIGAFFRCWLPKRCHAFTLARSVRQGLLLCSPPVKVFTLDRRQPACTHLCIETPQSRVSVRTFRQDTKMYGHTRRRTISVHDGTSGTNSPYGIRSGKYLSTAASVPGIEIASVSPAAVLNSRRRCHRPSGQRS
jgi:hypothetical protein